MMHLLIKTLISKMYHRNTDKQNTRKKRAKLRKKKIDFIQTMYDMYGPIRWHLSRWFGSWILYTCNPGFYSCDNTICKSKVVDLQKYKTHQFIQHLYRRG